MHSWINLTALWKIVVFGLAAGAGLPALFAIGLRVLNPPARVATAGVANGDQSQSQSQSEAQAQAKTPGVTAGAFGIAVAVLCFAVVLSAIGWGIDFIVSQG